MHPPKTGRPTLSGFALGLLKSRPLVVIGVFSGSFTRPCPIAQIFDRSAFLRIASRLRSIACRTVQAGFDRTGSHMHPAAHMIFLCPSSRKMVSSGNMARSVQSAVTAQVSRAASMAPVGPSSARGSTGRVIPDNSNAATRNPALLRAPSELIPDVNTINKQDAFAL